MSYEELRVILVVYISALLPIFIYLNNKSSLPFWVPTIYISSFFACAIGWELWFTYGWIDGDSVSIRRSETLNYWLPIHINWLMNSLADAGTITLGGLWLMWRFTGKDLNIFTYWNWKAFLIFMIWCITQNILVEMFLYHDQLSIGKDLSWAPLSPLGPYINPILLEFNNRSLMLQTQIPWIVLPAVIYMTVILLNKKGVM
ncbi:MAG: hypothetical protein ACJ0F7_04275 [Gammaproteobacteria bacterium]|jgi:hypothetical protein|tara:strand:+ start:1860 stop:2462 length:603 start_codon:yes stop_codon:yes gene_type:complete